MKKTKTISLITIMLCAIVSIAQDIQFTQFYQVPLYQNPAFAGSTHGTRATAHQRLQWPSLDSKYTTSFVSLDGFKHKYKSGFGGYVLYDQQGASSISSTQVAFQYSYELHLTKKIALRMGLQLGGTFQNVDYSVLSFPSQFSQDGIVNAAPIFNNDLASFFDASSGLVLYTPSLWVGFAAHHMNLPNMAFLGGYAPLPVKFSLTAGYKIFIQEHYAGLNADPSKEVSITPTFHYKTQGQSDQFDAGTYFKYHAFVTGLWYRGIPFKTYKRDGKKFQNNESMIFLIGTKLEKISLTYSYDWTVSTLSRAETGGSHELNITYFFKKPKKRKKPSKRMPCPSFYVH